MTTDQLSNTLACLADPTRRAIIARLMANGEMSVKSLAEPFAISAPAVTKHLKVLERSGLILPARWSAATVPSQCRAAACGQRLGGRLPAVLGIEPRLTR